MPKFEFELQRVRDIRAAQERIKQHELALERKKEMEILRKIEQLRKEQSEEYRRGQVFLTTSIADIRLFVAHQRYMEALERTIARSYANLDSQRQVVEATRLKLVEATRKRKLLDKLREKQLDVFKKEELTAEQKIIDEVGGGRFVRTRAEAETLALEAPEALARLAESGMEAGG